MSLVVCANQEKDGQTIRNTQSIYSAYSFKNNLTSTYKIPKNAQVALQSCKVNVDGRVVFSKNNNRFYQYTGEKLDREGVDPTIDDVRSTPVIVSLRDPDDKDNGVEELSLNDFAEHLGKRLDRTTYHPNYKSLTDVDVLRNASSLDFLGYKLQFDQNGSSANENNIPTAGEEVPFLNEKFGVGGTYAGGVFTRNVSSAKSPAVAIIPEYPLSLCDGVFEVEIGELEGQANASGVPWFIGLSRYVDAPNDVGNFIPSYGTKRMIGSNRLPAINTPFCDFGCARDKNGDLRVFDTRYGDLSGEIGLQPVKYFNNSAGNFTSRLNLSSDYTKVRFTATGERMKLEVYNANASVEDYEVVTDFSAADSDASQFKPINQACWCLHPVLGVFSNSAGRECSLKITTFNTPPAADLTTYDVLQKERSGWFETLALDGVAHIDCFELEQRDFNRQLGSSPRRAYVGLNASGGVDYDNVLIMDPDETYGGTPGANGRQILGFNNSIIDSYAAETGSNKVFESDFAPSLASSMAMFVRLNNFGQNVVNCYTGNKSKILAHLPRFDNTQTTGRLYFEPQNLVWIDLDNPAEMNVTEFDISFCYVNEQYATVLTGQSIVVLYFREKPAM
jgi:hypothetical protein